MASDTRYHTESSREMSSKSRFDYAVRYLATIKRLSFKELWKLSKEVAKQREQERQQKKEGCTSCNSDVS